MSLQEWYAQTNLVSVALLTYVSGLVSYRLWRMIALDTIFDRPRVAVLNKSPGWLVEMVQCPYCLGWWLNVAFAAAMYVWADISLPSAAIIALVGSALTGVIGRGD